LKSESLRLATGFLQVLPNLLHKDEGPLPYLLARDFGYRSTLVYWMKKNEPMLLPEGYDAFVKRVMVSEGDSRIRRRLGFFEYIARNARELDVLLMYHLTSESVSNAFLYKALNPKGVCVLKLDMDGRGLVAFDGSPLSTKQAVLLESFRRAPFDFVTIESEAMFDRLVAPLSAMGHHLHVLPVGIDTGLQPPVDAVMAQKKNVILTAGRLGVEQKNTEMLLAALELLDSELLASWEVWLVGSRTERFDALLSAFRQRRPDLSARVLVREFVNSRAELAQIYRTARVYCLTSRWESFGIVLAEAALAGCCLVATDVGIAREVTGAGARGVVVACDDAGSMAAALRRVLTGSVNADAAGRSAHEYARDRYGWQRVASIFDGLVRRYRKGGL
jgi:glycosyltransferase involved in cell wall biosynthesis